MNTQANELAWQFLLQLRQATRLNYGDGPTPERVEVTWNLMADPKFALVVLAIARLQDARHGQSVTAQDLTELGIPASAVRSALKWLREHAPSPGPTVRYVKNGRSWAFYLDA